MLESVTETTAKLGASYAKMVNDIQRRAHVQYDNQVKALEIYNDAAMQYTSEVHNSLSAMREVV